MSATSSPRSTRSHDRSASRTANTPSLPSKFRIPPTPPRIHRRLRMTIEEDGLLLRPLNDDNGSDDQGVLIEWGLKKAIRTFNVDSLTTDRLENATPTKKTINSAAASIVIGGILGRSHLWETSYLLFFLPPPDVPPNKLFPSTQERQFPEELPSVTPLGSAEDELRRFYVASSGEEASPAIRRERAESSATVKQGYAGLYRRDTISGPGKHGDPNPQDGSQGEFHTLKNVYALPLRKEEAAEFIKKLNMAVTKSKAKTKQSPDSASSTPKTDSQSAGQPSGTTTPADTPGRLFVKALNPQSWNLSIPLPGLTRNSSFEKTRLLPVVAAASAGTTASDSAIKEMEDELLTNAAETSATKEATTEDMPDPDAIMASVPATQTSDGQKAVTPLSRWAGMDKFIAGSGVAARAVGKGFSDMGKGLVAVGQRKAEDSVNKDYIAEQAAPLIEDDDAASETSELSVDDMMPPEPEGGILLNLPGKGRPGTAGEQRVQPPSIAKASVSQRKDLEAKIVREMCRELGSGSFFYSHEVDLSHTLQHKRRQITARTQSQGLLNSLLHRNASSSSRDSFGLAGIPMETSNLPSGDLDPAAEINGPDYSSASDEKEGGATWTEPDMNLPLWRRFDQRFMWNTWLLKEFVDLGLHEYILPVMQGWVQSSRFYIPPSPEQWPLGNSPVSRTSTSSLESLLPPPSTPVDLVVISRRSKDRAGLRFQRRGIDEDGNVANFVETEMIIRVKVEEKWNIFSFVIIRGSIPLFWSQTSTLTAMKPAPVLDRPVKLTTGVTRLHFDDLQRRYGPQTIVNLAEVTGKESVVTNGFREVISDLHDEKVRYKEFDFHNQCKGMHYENISKLIDDMDGTFKEQGYLWTCQDVPMREQSGTFRINCIDCLDRTAVVQSAFAHHVLISELTQVGVTPDSLNHDIDMVFNDIWANNGDAISRSYAGTSALKGDFTRTGKRDLTGMMNDGFNSLARMYSGAVSDFFAQAVLSYMVGERSIAVFHEMIETLQSSDSSHLMRLSRVRAAAIEVCAARVIESGESLSNGWVFLSPEKAGVKFSSKMEEKILLHTRASVYVVSFNYALEKVNDCTRIPLTAIKSIHKGAYIVKPLTEAGRDIQENAGFQIYFYPAAAETRLTTFSVMNHMPTTPTGLDDPPLLDKAHQNSHMDLESVLASKTVSQYTDADTVDFFAFKALSRDFHNVDRVENEEEEDRLEAETCKEVVERVVDRLKEEIARGIPDKSRIEELVVQKDVIGLEEAEKQTSLMARADYALKKLLWLP